MKVTPPWRERDDTRRRVVTRGLEDGRPSWHGWRGRTEGPEGGCGGRVPERVRAELAGVRAWGAGSPGGITRAHARAACICHRPQRHSWPPCSTDPHSPSSRRQTGTCVTSCPPLD
ncbi:hypothetical protein AAFF_G00346460 [Aldrovandia affinis]|uniref:Uncharacterized protein n=1 Tax=Aldrovandia affinis TaxID=143900 RepID=A0AAD7SJQ3_9TELE|nr:hypothetical protein AAFF_G00346460 [Aldrovandia affinis]